MTDTGLLDPLAHGTRAIVLTDDSAWLQAMVDVEVAFTRALVDSGLAPEPMNAVCDAIADSGRLDLPAIAAGGRADGTPAMALVTALRAAADEVSAGASEHVHVGATSQDVIDSATMLVATRVCDEVLLQLDSLVSGLGLLVDEHRATPMIGRTLGQHASQTTFGFVAAGWLDATVAAAERLSGARAGLPLQWGGAVGNHAVLAELAARTLPDVPVAKTLEAARKRAAERLGLRSPAIAWHTDRTPVASLAAALGTVLGVLGKFALDITVLARTELGELTEQLVDGAGRSSAMPHKRNPVTAVLIASAARQAPPLVASLFAAMLAEDQRPSGAWHSEWLPLRTLERLAVSASAAAADLVVRVAVDPARMAVNLAQTDGVASSDRLDSQGGHGWSLGLDAAIDSVLERSVAYSDQAVTI